MGSYDGCILCYKCLMCGVHFESGDWIKLKDPRVPLSFHDCAKEYERRMKMFHSCGDWYPPPSPLAFCYDDPQSNAKGVGELVGIKFPKKEEEKVSEHEKELEEQFAIVVEWNEVLENTLQTIKNMCKANLPQFIIGEG